jgi:phage/plasmid-associated DNA primase
MPITIPKSLQIPGIRFVLIEKASKKPFEKDWTNKEYFYDNPRLLKHLEQGGNYGVIGGGEKNLVILDFDNAMVQDQVCNKLPQTFTVRTGSGLLHKYFFSGQSESYKIFDEHMNTLMDIQSTGKQCIGPGSKHPNGNYYEVIDPTPIATIGYAELKALVMPFDKKPKRPTPDSEKIENKNVPAEYRDDTFLEQIKSRVSMSQVMAHIGVDVSKNPTNCFMHASKGGQCLGFNDVTWNCFHCVHPQQDVITLDGVKKISEVKVGDITINANGDRVPIIKVTKHPFQGKMLSIYVEGNNIPLKVTHNHGMYYYKDIICNANYRINRRCICKPECSTRSKKMCSLWKNKTFEVQGRVDASTLTTNDALFYPIPKTIIDKDYLDVSSIAKIHKTGPKRNNITQIPLSKEFLWVIGMYLAEGNPFRGGIKFSLHKEEKDYAKRILDCFKNELNLNGSTFNQVTPTGESLLVHICNSDIGEIFPIVFGKGCENKKVPREVLDLPIDKCSSLLRGILDGDGSSRNDHLCQTSKQLMIDTYELSLKVGYYPSMGLGKQKENRKQVYNMFPGTKGLGKTKINNHLVSPINRIDSEEYSGEVYDITVDSNHHSFLTPQGIIANCNEKGNIFTAIQKWKHCTFKEALEVLAKLGGMTEELKKSRKEYIEKQRKSADHERNTVVEQVANMINGKNKNYNGATEVIVDYILRNNHIYTTKDDLKSEMWIYREGIYSPNGRSEVKEIVRTVMLENFNMMLSNQIVAKIEADTYIETSKFFNQEYLYEVPVANGILNILTRELSPFSSDKVFFNKLPVTYDVEAKCEKIDKFIQDVLATENDKKMIYELAGYCLLKEYRFEKAFIFVAGGRNGKCQVKGSKVLMSDGNFKNVEDIRIGDEVLSPQIDGGYKFAKVIEVHNRFENDIYEVREQNRKKRLLYTCANNHLIPVIRTDKYNGERKLYHYEAQDLAKMYNGNSETCVFSTSAVEYKQPDSIINPYCFGAWLGDGHFSERKQKYKIKNIKRDRGSHGNYTNKSLGITTADKEVINEFEKVYPGIVMNTSTKKNNKASTYSFSVIGDFAKELIRLNQNAKGSEFKFIPKECLLSSIEYRKNLLAGLIDTDGYIDKVGQITYCTKSKQLAEDIKNLVFSLGGYADIRDIKKKAQNGFIGEYKDISIRFQNKTMIPLRTWKTSRLKDTKHDPRNIGINVVKKSDGEQVYGFELDSKQTSSQWYVTDNWIVTHNSKLIELIKRLVGLENCSGLPLASLNPESFSISELFGKMVNIASDISSNELKDTSVFKTLTGRDPISAKRKFLRDLTFSNYAKMIFACNTLPMVQDTTRGFFDRWVLLNFPYTFVPKEEYDVTEDKTTLKIRDEDIINKITLPEEMSGFLNAALDGLNRLLDNRGFTYEASVDEVKNNWIRKSNSFAAFCNDHIVQDYNGIISKKDLRRCYVAYCKKFKLLSKSDFVIKAELQNVFGANDSREEIMGQYTHVWEGINWIDGKAPTFKSHKNDVTEPRAPTLEKNTPEAERAPVSPLGEPERQQPRGSGASELPVQGTVPVSVASHRSGEHNKTL